MTIWDLSTQQAVGLPLVGSAGAWDAQFTDDEESLVSAHRDGSVLLWDVASKQQRKKFLGGRRDASSVAVSPNHRFVASGSQDGSITLWDFETGTRLAQALKAHSGTVQVLRFSSNGRLLASGGDDQRIQIWDPHQLKSLGAPLEGIGMKV
jgi:WD40 repeat protein